MEQNRPKYPIKVLLNTFLIFDILIKKNQPVSIHELSEVLNIYPSSIHRILDTLNYLGYIEKKLDSGTYQIGLKAIELGMVKLNQIGLIEEAMPYVEALSKEFNENVYLGVLFEGEVMFQAKKEAHRRIRLVTHIGTRAPLHSTSLGKVLIADLSKIERKKIIGNKNLWRITKKTIINKKVLENEIEKIQKLGYAMDDEENENEIKCIAAPIKDNKRKVVAAISISGPSYRFNTAQQKIMIKAVIETAKQISSRLGFKNTLVTGGV